MWKVKISQILFEDFSTVKVILLPLEPFIGITMSVSELHFQHYYLFAYMHTALKGGN